MIHYNDTLRKKEDLKSPNNKPQGTIERITDKAQG